jgi:nitroimidazol reductase NimA-like FMN-containing flavoprotein (pyridoxamine 5'-phosphate oxidase superfamily)
VAVIAEGWPLVVPVNYRFDGDTVLFHVVPGTKLAGADLSRVAFEVDEVAPDGHSGWSVLVQGIAYDITTALDAQAERLRSLRVPSALAEDTDRVVEVIAEIISGWRVGPGDNPVRIGSSRSGNGSVDGS